MLPTIYHRWSALITGVVIAAVPAQSQACCWLFNCFGHHSRTTFYAPAAVAAPACNTCVPQTVSYLPQTAYRPLVTTTPVMAMRPVMATDPCTGCPTTVMQPATSYVQRTVMMPYTTYRPVLRTSFFAPAMAAPACPTGACAPAATTTYYQPTTVAPVVSQPGCCATNFAPTTFSPISTTTTVPSIGTTTIINSSPAAQSPQTIDRGIQSPSDKNETFKQEQESNESGVNGEAMSLPRLTDPLNRTTSTVLPAGSYTPVAWKATRTSVPTSRIVKLDDSGWEAAR